MENLLAAKVVKISTMPVAVEVVVAHWGEQVELLAADKHNPKAVIRERLNKLRAFYLKSTQVGS
jgi:hypothetical protein